MLIRLAIWCAFFLPSLAPAADDVTVKTNYYTITGSSGPELMRSLAASRPRKGEYRWDAHTEWSLRYEYRSERVPGGCRLSGTRVGTTVTLTMPRWRYTRPPDPALVKRWQKYLGGLMRHEKGHEQLALDAGRELKRRLEELGTMECGQLAGRVKEVFEEVKKEFRRREAAYDKETDHGRTQGARWSGR